MIEDEMLRESDTCCDNKDIVIWDDDDKPNEQKKFISVKEQVGTFIRSPVAVVKKLIEIEIPAFVPDVIKKVIQIYQDTGKEADDGTE